jgi:ubiquinone/menaquinone biosynthesis C-methylase UbiE
MDKAELLADQYAETANLSTRGEFNGRYTVVDRHPHEWVWNELAVPPDASVLDIGCGPGAFWEINEAEVLDDWQVVLGDFSKGMVSGARDNLIDSPFSPNLTVTDAENLPFADETFDSILALQMLYHLPNRTAALDECRRILTSNGRLYATTGSKANAQPLFEMMSAVAGDSVQSLANDFVAENGYEQLTPHFGRVERHVFENEVRVDDPDALTAYALSLPLDAPELSAFEPEDAGALRERAAERIAEQGAIRWQKNMTLFVAEL